MKRLFAVPALSLCLALAVSGVAWAQAGTPPDRTPKVQVSFTAENPTVVPGGKVTVALHEAIRPGWHTYWVNPGDSGAATKVDWHLPPGWKADDIQWPYPKRLPVGPLMNYGFSDAVTLLMDITVPADAKPGETVSLPADISWLVCSDVCVPEDTQLTLSLAVAATAPPTESKALFAEARALLPKPAPWPAHYAVGEGRFALLAEDTRLTANPPSKVSFFPYTDGLVAAAAPETFRPTPQGLVLESAPDWRFKDAAKRADVHEVGGVLVLTAADGSVNAFTLSATPGAVPAAPASTGSALGLLNAILLAFAGGLVLNLMPCVLPVLSMKALALAGTAHATSTARREALAYGAGVVTTFAVLAGALLALRAGGSAVGWGFQLQQPVFVAGLALLMFAVGLNLSGLYEIGAGRLAGAGQNIVSRGGMLGSFLTGLLAVVVATPCTAPFMAAALGFALTETAPAAFAVFLALAVGFAAPFVLLGLWPRALRSIPRPGTWMIVFKQALAFPMYGAAIWLVWVLSQQTGPDGLLTVMAAALALAFAAWAYGASRSASARGHAVGTVATVFAVLLAVFFTARVAESHPSSAAATAEGAIAYEPYSAARLAALQAEGKPVFIDATAAWCITCLVNERVALSRDEVARAFTAQGVVALKADWTNQNPEITALLSQHGRSGVPLYLYFAPHGGGAVELPQILTPSIVIAALQSPARR